MSEENIIFGHLDTFCNRIKCVCDQIISLLQFQALYRESLSLSRPKREDISSVRMNRKDLESSNSSAEDEDTFETSIGNEELFFKNSTDKSSSTRNNNQTTEEVKKGVAQSLGILLEENENEAFSRLSISIGNKRQIGSSLIQIDSAKEKIAPPNNVGEINQELSSDSDFGDIEGLIDTNETKEIDDLLGKKNLNASNADLNPERLFKLEKSIESDSKRIMKKAHSLSKEDLKLISIRKFHPFNN